MPDSLERARVMATTVRDAGGRALIVGGWVRDRLMGLESKDLDIEVYGVASEGWLITDTGCSSSPAGVACVSVTNCRLR